MSESLPPALTAEEPHQHTAPDYYGRCETCGVRLEAPSRWMEDEAARTGGKVVTFTKKYRLGPPSPETT